MKKVFLGLLLLSAMGSFSSCKDSSKIPAPEVTSVPLIFPKVSSDPEKNHFDFVRARARVTELPTLANPTRPVVEFVIDIPDQRDVKIKAVEVYMSFQRINQPIGPRALAGSYSSFPATVAINSQDALTGLQQLSFAPGKSLPSLTSLIGATPSTRNPILNGDVIIFTFEYLLENGSKVILTPLTDVKLDVPAGSPAAFAKVISGNQINPPYALYARIN